jgi:hypothetical protein
MGEEIVKKLVVSLTISRNVYYILSVDMLKRRAPKLLPEFEKRNLFAKHNSNLYNEQLKLITLALETTEQLI